MAGLGCKVRVTRQWCHTARRHLAPSGNPTEEDSTQLYEFFVGERTKPRRKPRAQRTYQGTPGAEKSGTWIR